LQLLVVSNCESEAFNQSWIEQDSTEVVYDVINSCRTALLCHYQGTHYSQVSFLAAAALDAFVVLL
jgi:hypothetical protein